MSRTFDELQASLVERLRHTTPESDVHTIVVCPSLSFPLAELRKIAGIQHYEGRLLFTALLLRNPALEIVYPSSLPIDPAIIDYYLAWLDDPAGARKRLHLLPVCDPGPQPLTRKLLDHPSILTDIRALLHEPERSFILPFNVTPAEALLAETLAIPIYGIHPNHVALGSKSGARQIAIEAGVEVFPGAGDLRSLDELEAAIARLREQRPNLTAVVAKLNHGFSGQGNVIIDRDALRQPLAASAAVFCAEEETWETYAAKVAAEGAVVEELVRAPGAASPSVQLRILPGGRTEVLSTHDQILGGPDDQVYLGCRFPARAAYREAIIEAAKKVAHVLAGRGVLGSFGIDFVVVPDRGVYFSEINLRLGGTTHPFLMTHLMTGGDYDQDSGQLLVGGRPRVYKASDNIKAAAYTSLTPRAVIDAVAAAGLAYDPVTATGATLHLLGALPDHGKFGLVCIADSDAQADALHDAVLERIDALAGNQP